MPPRMPGQENRTVVIGRTGTGKTVAGMYHLSRQDFSYETGMPWLVIDFKLDRKVNSIPGLVDIDYSYVPKEKDRGLFIIHPRPKDIQRPGPREDSPLESYLWKIWERQSIGIFVDESYMLGDMSALNTILTQGREIHMPMILCTQRPVWVTRFAFSEATFFQVFDLNDADDQNRVESFTPINFDDGKLPKFNSWWYDVEENELVQFKPVPNTPKILETFREVLPKRRGRI